MDTIIRFIYDYGLTAIFFIILLEYACFPISSEIVLPFSGAVASLQSVPFMLILLVSVLAGLIGTSLCYLIGRFGRSIVIGKKKSRFPKINSRLNMSREKFKKYGSFAVCLGRAIPICRTYIAFVAGIVRQPFYVFLGYSAIGITLWNTLLIGIGYYLREEWDTVTFIYGKYKALLIPALLLVLLFLIYMKKCRKVNRSPLKGTDP